MIDLRDKALPNTVMVGGRAFLIETNFRAWINFSELFKNDNATVSVQDVLYLFKNEVPSCENMDDVTEILRALYEFYANPNATPTGKGTSERVYDYVLDGEYIYSAFRQAYGINLLKEDLHWHEFKALFLCLPDNTKMAQIMNCRSYKKTEKSSEKQAEESKRAWKLPAINKISQSDMDLINAEFL